MDVHFSAPWSQKVRLITLALSALLLFGALKAGLVGMLIGVGVLTLCLAFSVRGYSVAGGAVLIHHLGWAKRLPLADVKRAEVAPNVMVGSVRTFGIGGLFGIYGYFRNAVLGSYFAYATDPARAVVLEVGAKTFVVTPNDPARFVAAVEQGAG